MDINKNVSSVSDYLSIISELNQSYTIRGIVNSPCSCKFLYRGISDIKYKLLPSIFRKSHDYDEATARYIDNEKYTTFIKERDILRAFISEACAFIKIDPTKDLYKWAEYAQHYGVPTRFLDWSENPLVALYFACKDNKTDFKHDDNIGGKDAVVWMLHLYNYRNFANQADKFIKSTNKATELRATELSIIKIINNIYINDIFIQYPIIYKPYYTDIRMSAQSSMFMVWGDKEEPFENFFDEKNIMRSNGQPNNERHFSKQQFNEFIFDVHISVDCKQPILRELDNLGINEKTMFPGLDGLGKYIEMKYRLDYQEMKDYIL